MLSKIVALFLIVMLVLGMFGKLRLGNRLKGPRDQKSLGKPRRCKSCGRYVLGKGPCDCGQG